MAAEAAEEVLARDSLRTTTRAHVRADVSAAEVEQATAQTAQTLLDSIESGTVLDASDIAQLLAALGVTRSSDDEPARNQRKQRLRVILSKAEERDKQADLRDSAADHRDHEASLAWLLGNDDLGFSLQARRTSAMDRACSKDDRSLAASDRAELAELAELEP